MDEAEVLAVLALLDGIDVRVDGGWGVDALAGRRTRPHGDLDLVVPADRMAEVLARLTGFSVFRDLLPTAIALRDGRGREVDLHPVLPTADDGGDQDLGGDPGLAHLPPFHYGPPAPGRIGGVPVQCVSATDQRRARTGYVLRGVDHHDLAVLDALDSEAEGAPLSGAEDHRRVGRVAHAEDAADGHAADQRPGA